MAEQNLKDMLRSDIILHKAQTIAMAAKLLRDPLLIYANREDILARINELSQAAELKESNIQKKLRNLAKHKNANRQKQINELKKLSQPARLNSENLNTVRGLLINAEFNAQRLDKIPPIRQELEDCWFLSVLMLLTHSGLSKVLPKLRALKVIREFEKGNYINYQKKQIKQKLPIDYLDKCRELFEIMTGYKLPAEILFSSAATALATILTSTAGDEYEVQEILNLVTIDRSMLSDPISVATILTRTAGDEYKVQKIIKKITNLSMFGDPISVSDDKFSIVKCGFEAAFNIKNITSEITKIVRNNFKPDQYRYRFIGGLFTTNCILQNKYEYHSMSFVCKLPNRTNGKDFSLKFCNTHGKNCATSVSLLDYYMNNTKKGIVGRLTLLFVPTEITKQVLRLHVESVEPSSKALRTWWGMGDEERFNTLLRSSDRTYAQIYNEFKHKKNKDFWKQAIMANIRHGVTLDKLEGIQNSAFLKDVTADQQKDIQAIKKQAAANNAQAQSNLRKLHNRLTTHKGFGTIGGKI